MSSCWSALSTTHCASLVFAVVQAAKAANADESRRRRGNAHKALVQDLQQQLAAAQAKLQVQAADLQAVHTLTTPAAADSMVSPSCRSLNAQADCLIVSCKVHDAVMLCVVDRPCTRCASG